MAVVRAFLFVGVPFALFVMGLAAAYAPAALPAPAGPLRWDPPIEVATGEAFAGPWRMNDSDWRYVDDPTVALGEDGRSVVAFVDQRRQDVLLQVFDRAGEPVLSEPVNVSRSPGTFSWLPRLVVDGETVHVLWQEIVFSGGSHGGDIFYTRSRDGGRTFEAPTNLSRSTAGAGKGRLTRRHWHNGSLDLVRAPGGALYAAWTDYEGPLWFSRSIDGGETFSRPLRVAGDDASPARAPSIAAGPDGAVLLAYTVGEDRSANLRVARSTDGGASFGAPRAVFASEAHADAPKIGRDAAGGLHLVFTESPDGPFGRGHRIRYGRLDTDGAPVGEARTISDPLMDGFVRAAFPHLAFGPPGHVHVVFELYPGPRGAPGGLGHVRSTDGGGTFSPPAVVPGTADPGLGEGGSRQGLLMRKLDASPGGEVAVVQSHFRRGEASRVRLVRGR